VVLSLERSPGDRFDDALEVFRALALEPEFPAFLTVGAYARF
jgi:malate synthase